MKIIVMCGGKGKRLGSLTEQIPKPLVEISNRPILGLKIEGYLRQGYKDIIFCIGYKGRLIQDLVQKEFPKINAVFSDAGESAGILHRFHAAQDSFDDQVLMTYGDTYTDIDIEKFKEVHDQSDNEATIVVAPIQNPFGLVQFDRNNKVTFFQEKPVLDYYIGYAIINKTALKFVPEHIIQLSDGEGLVTFYKILSAVQKLGVYYHSGLQITFNTKEELLNAEKKLTNFITVTEKD